MRMHTAHLELGTPGRSCLEISDQVQSAIAESGVADGLCTVFVHHTSASLMICENADPQVLDDLERFMARLAPDGDPLFRHVDEGADDMPAHIRSILTQPSISIPVERSRCSLGTWQGIYLYEHRHRAHRRRVTVTVIGT
jgi:secondary thiamine-phosphate synthase enzyme